MDEIKLCCPSYKKAGNLISFKMFPGAIYYVHKFEAKEYLKKNQGIKIKVIPDSLQGNIAKVRNHILDDNADAYCTVMIDDDISYVGYYEDMERYKFKDQIAVLDFIKKSTEIAYQWGVKLWGINVNADKQNYREYSPFSTLSYISGSFSCFLRGNELRYDVRFSLKEDYDMILQQLNKYRKVLRLNKYFYSKKGAEQLGGCSAYRNIKEEYRQITSLIKKWGSSIVKVDKNDRNHRTKKNKTFDINPIVRVPIKGI